MEILHLITPYLQPIAISISSVALFVGIQRFLLKSGVKIQGTYQISSHVDCDDKWISEICLENLKDRAVTIYNIYLRLGYGCYLELFDFKSNPLILKSFETYKKEFDPICFYHASSTKVKLDELLGDNDIKKNLYLSTGNGKYKVRKPLRRWNPISLYFINYLTEIVHPVRMTYKDKSYGINILYLVELTFDDGEEQVIPVHRRENEWKSYKNFQFTKDSIKSKDSLEAYFSELIERNKIKAKSFKVYDLTQRRNENHDGYDKKSEITLEKYSFFKYYIVGYLFSYIENKITDSKNRKLAANRKIPVINKRK